jgi:hypothetical protein
MLTFTCSGNDRRILSRKSAELKMMTMVMTVMTTTMMMTMTMMEMMIEN